MSEPNGPPPPPPREPPAALPQQGNPWERRASLGVVNGFIEALKMFVMSPTAAFSETLKKGDFGSPLLFAVVVGWIGIVVSQIWSLLLGASVLSMLPAEMRDQLPFFMVGSASGLVLQIVFAPVFIIIGLFIWSAIVHLCLVIVAGLQQSEAGFEGSFRVVSYSSVGQLANLVPVMGGLLCLVWTLILAVIGIQQIHRSSQGKAIAAVLIPLVVCCVCVAIAVLVLGASIAAMFATQQG